MQSTYVKDHWEGGGLGLRVTPLTATGTSRHSFCSCALGLLARPCCLSSLCFSWLLLRSSGCTLFKAPERNPGRPWKARRRSGQPTTGCLWRTCPSPAPSAWLGRPVTPHRPCRRRRLLEAAAGLAGSARPPDRGHAVSSRRAQRCPRNLALDETIISSARGCFDLTLWGR